MKEEYTKLTHEEKEYMILNIKYKKWEIPVLLNYEDGKYIESLNKIWKCTDRGLIYSEHQTKNKIVDIYLHEIVMAKKMKALKKKIIKNKPIIYINRISIDNRRENLIYDDTEKDININSKKKKRIIVLPDNCNFVADDIPTYVWYMKPNKSHGERFIIKINEDITWKTGSSKKLSLKYKLEEAKKFLRELKLEKPELFEEYCMNGEFTQLGKDLEDSFFTIIKTAEYNITKKQPNHLTDLYLEENLDNLTNEEINLLQTNSFYNREKIIRRLLPCTLKNKFTSMPKHCYYKKAAGRQGDYFVIKNHPKISSWFTSTSKTITTKEKMCELLLKLTELNN